MTQTAYINGITSPFVNGVKGVNGISGAGQLSSHPTSTTAVEDDTPTYESDWNPDYLEGYTLEDVARARPLSNPYANAQIPQYAKLRLIDIDSFRTGHRPTSDELHREIRMTYEGQLPFTQILDRIVQDAYANLSELAEVMPSFNDRERKTRLIQYAVNTRKQIIKVYAISKWARVADDVQKALDVMTFLVRSESKLTASRMVLGGVAGMLHSSQLRNADIMSALDILTTGTYQGLPSVIKETFQDYQRISDEEVISTLRTLNDAILYRLRFRDIVPVSMNDYHVGDGRVCFKVPGLFEVTLTLTGPEDTDYWYALDVRFLVAPNGDDEEILQEFPSMPHPWLKTQIINSLNYQLVMNCDQQLDVGDGQELPRARRDPSRVDAPLVRMYNALHLVSEMLSLSYQLEILYQQAARMLKLDWQDIMATSMDPSRKSFTVTYWKRPTQLPPNQAREGATIRQDPIPPLGGTVTFAIVTDPHPTSTSSAAQIHVNNVLTLLEGKTKLKDAQGVPKEPSDVTELASIRVDWRPVANALATPVPSQELQLDLAIDSTQLDLEGILKRITRLHARAILKAVGTQLLRGTPKSIFSDPSQVSLEGDESSGSSLRVRLCGSQEVLLSVDDRSGRLILKDVGVLAASNRSGRFVAYGVWLNRHPNALLPVIKSLKVEMIIAEIEHQARYLGLQATRSVAVPPGEAIQKFGNVRMAVYIRLKPFPDYYLAMLATEEEIKWALVNLTDVQLDHYNMRSIRDFGWLDAERIGGADDRERAWEEVAAKSFNDVLKKTGSSDASDRKTENHSGETSSSDAHSLSPFSSTARSVPKICIRISDTVRSERAANVAYENVKIKVVDWWSERPCRVVTSVRLREVQLVAKDPSGTTKEQPFDPARNITYNPTTSIVTFTSFDINTCVDEFLQEWERVERVAGIAREVDQARSRRQWPDIRILRFNLQSVEFIYHSTYTLAIQWVPPSEAGDQSEGTYAMDFGILPTDGARSQSNPHQDVATSLSKRLHVDASRSMAFAVERLIMILRDSLPVLLALQSVKHESAVRITMSGGRACPADPPGIRHILDFRLLPNQRVAVADAALSPFTRLKAGDEGGVESVLSAFTGFQDVAHALAKETQPAANQQGPADPAVPPVVVVEGGLLCGGPTVPDVLRRLCAELSNRLWPPS
ncbi:mediator complex subunit [Tulasnella sp. 408]|nr:mediator complex subunit [Tulasnella sp. 408]